MSNPFVRNRPFAFYLSLIWLMLLGGCARAPSFDILGSFFPAWIACMIGGILLTLLTRMLLDKMNWERELRFLPLVYLSLSSFFACVLWLLLFE